MDIKIAASCGFCFGVKRAIRLAEENAGALTLGELIHNKKETSRLESDYSVHIANNLDEIDASRPVIIRTHGIEKETKAQLLQKTARVIDATCPYVTKPQEIAAKMSQEGYTVVIFGDKEHPEVKGVRSYADGALVVSEPSELVGVRLESHVALISQTTKTLAAFRRLADYLIERVKEVRVFNTICNATFDNQEATRTLAGEVQMMIVIGGKNSSNTKQLYAIAKQICDESYLVEDASELEQSWFAGKKLCGISAGASTPDWIIREVQDAITRL